MAPSERKPTRLKAPDAAAGKEAAVSRTLEVRLPRPFAAEEEVEATEGDLVVLRVDLRDKRPDRYKYTFTWDTDIPIRKRAEETVEWDTTGVEPGHYAITVTVTELVQISAVTVTEWIRICEKRDEKGVGP